LRLQLPLDTPLCVVQWGSALAVSYAARPFGIKRGDRVEDIRRKAGTAVTIVSVETMGAEVGETPCENPERLRVAGDTALKNSVKVSLARYRDASMAVFNVISSMIPSTCAFERASIDEVFLDVSAAVRGRLAKRSRENGRDAVDIELGLPKDTFVYGGNSITAGSLQDSSLFEGARFASELRESVYRECGYTMSAGIASNKMLAKYASALNKPGKQTIMLPSSVEELLSQVPITDFRGCGGKIGKAIQDMGFKTAAVCIPRPTFPFSASHVSHGSRHRYAEQYF
jgi:DNA polymerase eta